MKPDNESPVCAEHDVPSLDVSTECGTADGPYAMRSLAQEVPPRLLWGRAAGVC